MGKFKDFITEGLEPTAKILIDKLRTTYKGKNLYVHFSNWKPNGITGYPSDDQNPVIPFLSINKTPSHTDAIGIYAFPANYVATSEWVPPFFSQYPYAYILAPTSHTKILKLSSLSEKSSLALIDKMGISRNYYLNTPPEEHPAIRLFAALKEYAKEVSGGNNKKASAIQNILLRKTQYNAIFDDGIGVFLKQEPIQVVFLDPRAYKLVEFVNVNKVREVINWLKRILEIPIKSIRRKRWSRFGNPWPSTKVTLENGFVLDIGMGGEMISYYNADGQFKAIQTGRMSTLGRQKAEEQLRADTKQGPPKDTTIPDYYKA